MTGHKCRNPYCPNRYSDIVGKKGWTQSNNIKGAECIPCLYANQMADGAQTPEQVERVPQLMEMFTNLLAATGWKWQDIKDAHARVLESRVP